MFLQKYKEEFPPHSGLFHQAIRNLENVIENLNFQSSAGSRATDLVPSYILNSISNILEALLYSSGNRTELPDSKELTIGAVNLIETYLTDVYLATQVTGEGPFSIATDYFSTKGERSLAQNAWNHSVSIGPSARAVIPEGLLTLVNMEDEEEVFQIITNLVSNPFDWGYEEHEDDFVVTSQVVSLSFKFADNKSDIKIVDLPDGKLVQLWIPTEGDTSFVKPTVGTPRANQNQTLETTADIHLAANQSLQTPLLISSILDSGSAANVQIDIPNARTDRAGVLAYLAKGYVPFWYKYDQVLNVTKTSLESTDHSKYTFFIYDR